MTWVPFLVTVTTSALPFDARTRIEDTRLLDSSGKTSVRRIAELAQLHRDGRSAGNNFREDDLVVTKALMIKDHIRDSNGP